MMSHVRGSWPLLLRKVSSSGKMTLEGALLMLMFAPVTFAVTAHFITSQRVLMLVDMAIAANIFDASQHGHCSQHILVHCGSPIQKEIQMVDKQKS